MRFLRVTFLWLLLLPTALEYLGAGLNQLVIYVNHGRFPVATNIARYHQWVHDPLIANDGVIMLDEVHCVMTSKTHLNILADIFDLHDGIYSVGDFLLMGSEKISDPCLYAWFALVLVTLYENRRLSF